MEVVKVDLREEIDNSYDIVIGRGLLDNLAMELRKIPANEFVIITDSNIAGTYGKRLLNDLKNKNIDVHLITFSAGEKSKTRKTKEKLENEMLRLNLGRDACIIALGGGVAGDIAGFAAATYMRGIPYIHVPTTLLAMVDSSIGGKVAVDTGHAKNAVGAFYQPKKVVIDLNFLKTLPKKELVNGLAELIKHALIKDKDFFHFIEKNIDRILACDADILKTAIKRSCEIKADIVMQDEKEKGLRRILNYGHTIGHAIESALSYRISHGNAIAIGMSYAAKLSAKLGHLHEGSVIRQNNLLEYIGLPHKLSHHKLKPRRILEHVQYDKKIMNGRINFVLLNSIGDAFVSDEVNIEDIKNILEEG
ncbi:MAG TPA: 3-dehydroquinate synthase [Candidatus Nanoarchaeia archaeon]|nr:3-dehydroquinate synthase [Candidatus Nanoarchaeia archaeon]